MPHHHMIVGLIEVRERFDVLVLLASVEKSLGIMYGGHGTLHLIEAEKEERAMVSYKG